MVSIGVILTGQGITVRIGHITGRKVALIAIEAPRWEGVTIIIMTTARLEDRVATRVLFMHVKSSPVSSILTFAQAD